MYVIYVAAFLLPLAAIASSAIAHDWETVCREAFRPAEGSWFTPQPIPASNYSGFVNVSLAPSPRLVLNDDGEVRLLNLTVTRRSELGPLCIHVRLLDPALFHKSSPSPWTATMVGGQPYTFAEPALSTVDGRAQFVLPLALEGRRLGRGRLSIVAVQQVHLLGCDDRPNGTYEKLAGFFEVDIPRHDVLVRRPPTTKTAQAFSYMLTTGLAINILSFSCRLDFTIIRHHIRHPSSILIGLACQSFIMPTMAFLFGLAFNLPATARYALLTLGCSPGGGPSNFVTLLLHGDIAMSVLMTFFSNVFSIGFMPLWLCTLGQELLRAEFPGYVVSPPWNSLVLFALIFAIPTIVGIGVCRFVSERVALITSYVIRIIGIAVALIGFVGTIYFNAWMFDYDQDDWRIPLAVTIFSHVGYVISLVLARIFARRSFQSTMTIVIEAAVQAMPNAMTVLALTAPQPEATVAFVVVEIYLLNLIATICLAWLVSFSWNVWKYLHGEPVVIAAARDASPSMAEQYKMPTVIELQADVDCKPTLDAVTKGYDEPEVVKTSNGCSEKGQKDRSVPGYSSHVNPANIGSVDGIYLKIDD